MKELKENTWYQEEYIFAPTYFYKTNKGVYWVDSESGILKDKKVWKWQLRDSDFSDKWFASLEECKESVERHWVYLATEHKPSDYEKAKELGLLIGSTWNDYKDTHPISRRLILFLEEYDKKFFSGKLKWDNKETHDHMMDQFDAFFNLLDKE